ncbi:MAG: hemolysin family protein [Anaerolineae bacterium]|nr:hemolysin family protein [Anaerolineae bacterium]
MSEAALISSRRARLQQRADEGDAGAKAALELSGDPTRFLSTVQVGITLIGILSGAFGGASLAGGLSAFLKTIPPLARYSDALGLALVVLFITYLSLVLGELVPKRLALNNAEGITSLMARPMQMLSRVVAPVVYLLSVSTELILRLLGMKPSQEPAVTEEEVEFMMEEGTQAGIFEEAEQDIVNNLFRIGDRRVSSVMTYRSDIIWIDVAEDYDGIRKNIANSRHVFYPVFEGEPGNLIGVLSVRDLLPALLQDEKPNLRDFLRSPLYVPESMPVLRSLETFRTSGTQAAIIINEHGDIEGMVTISDIIGSIIGEFPEPDVTTISEADAVQREDGSWLLDGLMHIDDLAELLGKNIFPEEEHSQYETLSGFVMTRMGRIPHIGDHFEWEGMKFEIVDMDGRRVDRVLVKTQDNA